MTTTGMQRVPGVQVRLEAGSPMATKHSHLNPGFKVVSRASSRRRMFFLQACLVQACFVSGVGVRNRRANRQYGDATATTRYAVPMTTQPLLFP
jgi:hypothetical protein